MEETRFLDIVNHVRANKRQQSVSALSGDMRLREDLGFESLDLAELTVRIEEAFGVDVFSDGLVQTVGEIETKIARSTKN